MSAAGPAGAATPTRPGPRFGLRWRLAALVGLVCLVGVGAATWSHLRAQTGLIRQGLNEQSVRTAEIMARSVTAQILRNQVSALRELGEEALRSQPGDGVAPVVYVTVVGRTGQALFDSNQEAGREVLPGSLSARLTANALAAEALTIEVVPDREGHPVQDIAVPCGVVGVDGVHRVYGLLRLGVRLDALADRWYEALEAALAAGLAAVALGLFVGFVATGRLLRFVQRMAEVVGQFGAGDLSPRIGATRADELGELATAIDRMADDLQKRELLKRYISATAWDEIEERGVLDLGEGDGTLREVTVLFLDIRNYTSLSEDYESREIVAMLNEVFTVLIGVVDEFGGVLDKFIGDALLVVFYPGDEGDDAVRAVYAACRMQEALRAFNQRREFYGRDAITIGVGINTGTVIAGSVGSERRRDYTVIGDPVNVASRLQERSKEGAHTRVILSRETLEQVGSLVETVEMAPAAVRGKREEIAAYEVVAVRDLVEILANLEAEDPQVRQEAFQALEATGGGEAVPFLIKLLGDAGEDAVLKAIPTLARLGRDSATVTRLLASLAQEEQDPRVLATALRALGGLPGFEDTGLLRRFLIHEDARVRANTIEALEVQGAGEALDAIAPLLHDPNQRVKANAAVVLWKHGRREVVRVLLRLAREGAVRERSSAIFALGELFASEARSPGAAATTGHLARAVEDLGALGEIVETLIACLDDPEDELVDKAVRVLARIRDPRALAPLAELARRREAAGRDPGLAVTAMARVGAPPRVARLLRDWRAQAKAAE